jgi:hypothetical protein
MPAHKMLHGRILRYCLLVIFSSQPLWAAQPKAKPKPQPAVPFTEQAPPADAQVKERRFYAALQAGGLVPIGDFASLAQFGFGAEVFGTYQILRFRDFTLAPAVGAGLFIQRVNMAEAGGYLVNRVLTTSGGLDLGFVLARWQRLSLHFVALAGLGMSSVAASGDAAAALTGQQTSGRDFYLRSGLEARYQLKQQLSVFFAGSYSRIFYAGPDLANVQLGAGAGWSF